MTLAEHVRRYVPLSSDDESRLAAAAPLTLDRRSHLFQAGEPGRFLVFVETGLLRLYSLDEAIKERTHQFALEGWWIADWEAFDQGIPAAQSMQAVETSAVRVLRFEQYEPLLTQVSVLERYFRRVYQRAFAASQRRLLLYETSSSDTRYHEFARHFPDFVQRVPQYMLASFLGFTPEFLSRIRARS